jgi:hypothetical protein
MHKTIAAVLGSAALVGWTQGCTLQTSDAERFREPIPQSSDATLALPGSLAAGGSAQSASAVRVQNNGTSGGAGTSGNASFYSFTRGIADTVYLVTVLILGEITAVTSLPPTTIDASHAVWGPGSGDALDPVSWKLTVTRAGDGGYDYEVDGRPHLSTSEADWRAILTGHGYDRADSRHRSGTFTVDSDALRALDPSRNGGTGTVKVTFDSRSYPVTITADVTTNDGTGQWFDVAVTHEQDGSGVVAVTALGDVSTPKDGTNENVAENSRWNATGAGRADVKMTGGDFGSKTVLASQCWSNTFAQTYYTDSVDYAPTTGDPSSCAFGEAQFTP